jgi:hypothetical protein
MEFCTEVPVVAVLSHYNSERQNGVATAEGFVYILVMGTEINYPNWQRFCRLEHRGQVL